MSKWQNLYEDRLCSAEEAAATIASNEHIWFPTGFGEPEAFVRALVARKESLWGVVTHQLLPVRSGYFDEASAKHIRLDCLFVSGTTRESVNKGWSDLSPNYFSEIPQLIREYWQVDTVGVVVAPMDEHGNFSLGLGVDYIWEAMKKARKIIVEVNPNAPRCYGNCHLPVSAVSHIVENNSPLPELPVIPLTETDIAIGAYVAEMIQDGSTLQIGFGGVPNAVCKALENKKDLGVHTEMMTEGIMELTELGALNNSKKNWNRGKMIGTFAMGSKKLYEFMNNNPMVEMHPVEYTNNPYNIGRNDNMIAINASIEVDLLGQCCSESMGSYLWSSTGGQVDFFRGANLSKGGKGFVTMPSTAIKGTVSRIVPTLKQGAVVTTSKNDVDHVVTEYGVAKLRGKNIRARAKALIEIANPDFKHDLIEAAKKMNLL